MLLRIMSFNIRTAAAPDGELAWPHRRGCVIARIRAFAPDLLGLQECCGDGQGSFIRRELADYEFVGVPRGGEAAADPEMAPLLYRRAEFEELARGHFWLSATPGVAGSRAWGAAYPRTASWVRLRPRRRGRPGLLFLNTHFDYAGQAPESSARLLRLWVEARAAGEGPLVLTGDFNAGRGSAAHRLLTAGGILADALAAAGVAAGSFQDFGRAPVAASLDWILVSRELRVMDAAVDDWRAGRLYPSDHYPVTAVVAWEG
jgi:endonuclease/exonuclease/phosphatase family metal-dependent hydrolase